jgi:hypothetical protein
MDNTVDIIKEVTICHLLATNGDKNIQLLLMKYSSLA